MKRRKLLWIIPPLILIFCMAWFALRPDRQAQTAAQFEQDRARLEALAAQVMEQGNAQGIEVPAGWQGVAFYDGPHHTVEFSYGAWGMGSETAYWGINYVPSNAMIGFQGQRWDYWKAEGDGRLYYDPEGDNTCYVEKLDNCWYYYEMSF